MDKKITAKMWNALEAGDAGAVKELLSQHPELRSLPLPFGANWLHMAIDNEQLPVVQMLINEKMFAIDSRVVDNLQTPLHFAALLGNVEIVEWLLAQGAVVDAEDKYGRTPLISAAIDGSVEIIGQLLNRGANPHVKGGNPPKTAMEFAQERGNSAAVDLLRSCTASKSQAPDSAGR